MPTITDKGGEVASAKSYSLLLPLWITKKAFFVRKHLKLGKGEG
jgi:hypothetical protein